MQRCPKCGYREKVDWPFLLLVVAFGLLFSCFMAAQSRGLKGDGFWWLAILSGFLFLAGAVWKVQKNWMDETDFEQLNQQSRRDEI